MGYLKFAMEYVAMTSQPNQNLLYCKQCGSKHFIQPEMISVLESQVICNNCGAIVNAKDLETTQSNPKPNDLLNELVEKSFQEIFKR